MKQILVTILLAFGLFSLMIFLDIQMGLVKHGIVWKTINPFRVMETAEYIILGLFILFFLFNTLGAYLKKKRQSNPPPN